MVKEIIKFSDLGLSQSTLDALDKKGFTIPTPIQQKCIPLLLAGNVDIAGQAMTGTGKTAAFGLPILEIVQPTNTIQALILTPTRELAMQVSEEIKSLQGDKRLKVTAIYGKQSYTDQLRQLKAGVQIVVGTPGRIIDHLTNKKMDLSNLSFLVLDEADEMLNMGFIDDIKEIFEYTPKEKRMLLFSATMPAKILSLIKRYMPKYEFIHTEAKQITTDLTKHVLFEVREKDKFESLCRIIDIENEFYGLVFCKTKIEVDKVSALLVGKGYNAEALHGGLAQTQRERTLARFKDKKIKILIATDVAARGIHVNDISHVVNFSIPQDQESYIHRIGRTGRAGKEGVAITLATPSEFRKIIFIEKNANIRMEKKTIPDAQEIITAKRVRILNQIKAIIGDDKYKSKGFNKLALEISLEYDPQDVISALLGMIFKDALDEKGYQPIHKVSPTERETPKKNYSRNSKDKRERPPFRSSSNRGSSSDRSSSTNRNSSTDRSSSTDSRPKTTRYSGGRSAPKKS
ncbi:MAG: DEAD/DEAH box helicase [Deltaproteobacteria bacterium]